MDNLITKYYTKEGDKLACDTFDLCKNIDYYIENGWKGLTTLFTGNKIGKKKIQTTTDSNRELVETHIKIILELIGSVRKYIIHSLFSCIVERETDWKAPLKCNYESFGSTDILSDYDINIMGFKAPEITFEIFSIFCQKYGVALPYAFDTNIYCNGYYLRPITLPDRKNMKTIKYKKDNILYFDPSTPNLQQICLKYALLKLYEVFEHVQNEDSPEDLKSKFSPLKEFFNTIQQKDTPLQQIYTEVLIELESLQSELDKLETNSTNDTTKLNNYNKLKKNVIEKRIFSQSEVLNYIRKYVCMYHHSIELYDMLYKKERLSNKKYTSETFLIEMCRANYFAIEAYYTPCTINVVVLEGQAKLDIKLHSINYVCSIIENLGDLLHHFITYYDLEKTQQDQTLLAYFLKYMYRIAYSLNKLGWDNEKSLELLKDYKNHTQENPKFPYPNLNSESYLTDYISIILKKLTDHIAYII